MTYSLRGMEGRQTDSETFSAARAIVQSQSTGIYVDLISVPRGTMTSDSYLSLKTTFFSKPNGEFTLSPKSHILNEIEQGTPNMTGKLLNLFIYFMFQIHSFLVMWTNKQTNTITIT